jgi:hypothetical protein
VDKLSQDINRETAAKAVLEMPAFQEAVANVRAAITTQWATSPIRDTEGQHELRLMLKLLDDLMLNLKSALNDGHIARIEIERQSKLDRMRRTWAA